MDRGAWWATVHGVTQSQTQLKQMSAHAHRFIYVTISESQHLRQHTKIVTKSSLRGSLGGLVSPGCDIEALSRDYSSLGIYVTPLICKLLFNWCVVINFVDCFAGFFSITFVFLIYTEYVHSSKISTVQQGSLREDQLSCLDPPLHPSWLSLLPWATL